MKVAGWVKVDPEIMKDIDKLRKHWIIRSYSIIAKLFKLK